MNITQNIELVERIIELSGEEITLSVSGQEKAIVLPKKSLFSCSY